MYVQPASLAGVKEDMACYTEEIFGPVLCCMHVPTLDDAIALVNRNAMGNGVALFTASGGAARKFGAMLMSCVCSAVGVGGVQRSRIGRRTDWKRT